ncbi:MAG: hypothetical protein U0929_18810 [Planctomycetaceae bacterium]
MPEKLRPWSAMIFCTAISLLTIAGNLFLAFKTRIPTNPTMDFVLFTGLPMCFFHIGSSLSMLQKENRELRAKVDELSLQLNHATPAA